MASLLFVEVVTCVVLSLNTHNQLQSLILKRSDHESEGPGLWTIPGGKVEQEDFGPEVPTKNTPVHEGILDSAVIRETRGETGILLRAEQVITIQKKALVFIRKNGTPTMVHRFFALCEGVPTVVIGSEATDYAWVTHDMLPQYDFIGKVAEDIPVAMRECAAHYKHLNVKI